MKIEKIWTLQFALKTDRPIRQARHSEFISLNSEMRSLRLLKSSNLNQQHENTQLKVYETSKDAENEIFYKSEGISQKRFIWICFQILTKDSVTVFVNAILYYKVCVSIKDNIKTQRKSIKFSKMKNWNPKVANATHAVANVDDYSGSARLLAATTLRLLFQDWGWCLWQ